MVHRLSVCLFAVSALFWLSSSSAEPPAATPPADPESFAKLVERAYELHVSDPMQSIAYGERAMELVDEETADAELVRKLNASLAWAYLEDGRFDRALELAEINLANARAAGNAQLEIRALRAVGQIHADAGREARALEVFLATERLSRENDRYQLGGLLISLGQTQIRVGDLERGLRYYHEASNFFEEKWLPLGSAVALSNVADVHRRLGHFDDAMHYLEQARAVFLERDDVRRVALMDLDMGNVHREAGRPDEALAAHRRGLEAMQKLDLRLEVGRQISAIGKDYVALGDLDAARDHLGQALQIWRDEGHLEREVSVQLELASVDRSQGGAAASLRRLEQTLATIQRIETDRVRRKLEEEAVFQLATTYEALGRSDAALDAMRRHETLLRQRLESQRTTSLADATTLFELDMQQKEIELLEQKEAYQALVLERQQQTRQVMLVLFTLLLIVAGLLYNRERLRARAAEESARHEREKAARLDQIKVLSGLLPICAVCKKIRDEAGYWNQVEAYIDRNSEATFTHGLCETCMEDQLRELMQDS
ncbi:hypothetical protein ABI59_18545 [Acidobacteria bacterium Mor1]|nr:hypothetical protein ABI59_18545 [Acidobacteria bacterium Mor1]